MALPAIKAVAALSDRYEFHLLIPAWSEPLYRSIESVKLIPLTSGRLHGFAASAYQADILRKGKFDGGIILPPSFSSALTFFLGRVKNRFGYRGEGRHIFLNRSLEAGKIAGEHRAREYFKLVEYFAETSLPFSPPTIVVSPDALTSAENLLDDFSIAAGIPLVAIAPRAVAPSRRWGSDNYAALAKSLIDKYNFQIILVGGKDEYDAAGKIAYGHNQIHNLCGKTDIASAAALLARAKLFIGNDSGLAHLAAAVNIPMVVLSGADNPRETSPLSNKKIVIIKDYLNCISCVKNICRLKGESFMRCMRDISVSEVLVAAERCLAGNRDENRNNRHH
jgi:heptosyltransferase-2